MKKILKLITGHKIISFIILAAVIYGGYFGYQKINPAQVAPTYQTAAAAKGMFISSISGTGQISASNQIDIVPKASGDIISVNIKSGQEVKEGDLIAQIDSRDSARSLNEAKSSLENAKLDLENLLAPTDEYTLIQAKNTLADAEDSLAKLKISQKNNYDDTLASKQKAEDNLVKAYEDAYNTISNTFLDLPDVLAGLYTILYGDELAKTELTISANDNSTSLINSVFDLYDNTQYDNNVRDYFEKKFIDKAKDDYEKAKSSHDASYNNYKDTSRYSDRTTIDKLLKETLDTAKKVSDTVKSEANTLDYWVSYRTDNDYTVFGKVISYQSDLASYTSKVNSHLSNLLSAQRSIEDYIDSIAASVRSMDQMKQNNPLELAAMERSLAEKKQKIVDLEAGASEFDIKSKQLSIQQKQNSLLAAQQNYADYFVRAPFAGTIASVNAAKGDSASSGSSIAILITKQKIAEVTLNEIDSAKIKVGQKASLQFDALPDLLITGEVGEVDSLGAVNQGVVSYNIKIGFDVQDERVKPGMSVSVNIIIESKQDVLLVPLSAIKSSDNQNYVEVLVNGAPQRKTITIGSTNDTTAEIIDGLKEGEEVITQTITNSASNSSNQTIAPSQNGQSGFGGELRMLR
jgi:HlyD family secretion protein